MAETIQCPQCRAKLQVPEKSLGKKIKCPACQTAFSPTSPEQPVKPADAGYFALTPEQSPTPQSEFSNPAGSPPDEPNFLSPEGQSIPSSTKSLAPVSGPLKIVLFGLPDSGKTSLLGALAHAAQSQEHILNARLVDGTKDQGLAELTKQVYEDQPSQTIEEVVTYPMSFETTADGAPDLEAIVVDCDGRAAGDFLSQKQTLDARTELGKAFRKADTLVMTLDVAAAPEKMDREFSQFCRFLHEFEENRGKRVEVAGLAVYLVLTKCDLLARPNDSAAVWMQRIEERKRKAAGRFQEYLASRGRVGPVEHRAFGKIDVHVWATAVRRPTLADRPARVREPYGVAELFRQCLESSVAHQHRRNLAGQFLVFIATGMLAVVGVLGTLAYVLYEKQPSAAVAELDNRVHILLPRSISPAQRLNEPEKKLKELKEVKENPVFGKLPQEDQGDVDRFVKELEEFQRFSRDFNEKAKDPKLARNDEELDKYADLLKKNAPPDTYADQWKAASVFKRREQYLSDVEVLRREADEAVKKFKELDRKREALQDRAAKDYRTEADKLIDESYKLPYYSDPTRPLPGSRSLTYADVLHFERVARFDAKWKAWCKDPRPK